MQTAIWKFLALTGVIGLGCFVVYQVHTRIPAGDPASARPEDFTPPGAESSTSAESPDLGTPTLDTEAPESLGLLREPQSDMQASPDAAPPLIDWDDVPVQAEPATSDPVANLTSDPGLPNNLESDPFWSNPPSAPASFPGELNEPEASVVQTDSTPPSAGVTSLFGDPIETVPAAEPAAAVLPDFDAGPGLAGQGESAPLPLNPIADLRPLPGAFVPDDEDSPEDIIPEFADSPARIADDEVMPVEGLGQGPEANPFAFAPELPADTVPEGENEGLPLVDFLPQAEPLAASAPAEVDPFPEFAAEPSRSASVMPADPQAAGFAESSPPAVRPQVDANPFALPPQVDANPFATPPRDDESSDPFDDVPGPSNPGAEPLPVLPALASDPFGEVMPDEESPEPAPDQSVQSEPFPALNIGEFNSEPPPSLPLLPAASDGDFGNPAVASEVTTDPFSAAPDDEEDTLPLGTFNGLRPDPLPLSEPDAGSVPPLDLIGDATIEGEMASGAQQPELEIEKIAPAEATVGEPLIYSIHIKNVGSSAAHGVVVEDRIPRGTTLDGTIPQAELTDKVLTWRMGTIGPGQEETIRIRVIPTDAGEIGSVAVVRFAAEVAAATNITSADLRLEMAGPHEISVGETAVFRYQLTNAGNGTARGAYIRCLLPAALEHPGGADIEYDVGDLPPGESSTIELTVRATEAGTHRSRTLLNAGSRTYDESELTLNVLPSRLLINREGPARRFVGRAANYTTVVTNRSSSPLTGITVVEQLPTALDLAAIPDTGQYDPVNRTVTWTIPGLAAGESFSISSSMVGREYGLHSSSITARDRSGNEATVTSDLQVAGFSTIEVDWEHEGGPVAVGEQVALRLTVRNQGTAPAENVQAVFEVPPQMEFVNADGPVSFQQEGRLIRFDNIDELPIDGEQTFDIVLTAAAPGSTRVSAQLRTADHVEPLRHDEPVFILQDEF